MIGSPHGKMRGKKLHRTPLCSRAAKAGVYALWAASIFDGSWNGLEAEINKSLASIDDIHAFKASRSTSSSNGCPPYHSPKVQGAPKFVGGCVGYWSYDVIRTIEKLPEQSQDDLPIPDYSFAMYDQVWTLDHTEKSLYIAVHMPFTQGADLSRALRAGARSRRSDARPLARDPRRQLVGHAAERCRPTGDGARAAAHRRREHRRHPACLRQSRLHGCGGAHPSLHLPR